MKNLLRRLVVGTLATGLAAGVLAATPSAATASEADTLENQVFVALDHLRDRDVKRDVCLDGIATTVVKDAIKYDTWMPPYPSGRNSAAEHCYATNWSIALAYNGPTHGQTWVDEVRAVEDRDAVLRSLRATRVGIASQRDDDGTWWTAIYYADGATAKEQAALAAKKKAEKDARERAAHRKKVKAYESKYKKCLKAAKKKNSSKNRKKARYKCQDRAKSSCIRYAKSKQSKAVCKRVYRRR